MKRKKKSKDAFQNVKKIGGLLYKGDMSDKNEIFKRKHLLESKKKKTLQQTSKCLYKFKIYFYSNK
jgi:hypothetical protein